MRNNFLPYLFFLSLTLVPNVHAQTSRSASMPVPFEPFDTGNAVSAEFLKLYKENPKNTAIPADILAILQTKKVWNRQPSSARPPPRHSSARYFLPKRP